MKASTKEDVRNKLLLYSDKKENGCWVWNKSRHRQGYGNLTYEKKNLLAHRVSWIIFKGEIEDGKKIFHICDNPPCVNPDHLFIGTQRDNIIDMFNKNRATHQKITREQANEIRLLYSKNICTIEISERFGISKSAISMIVNNKIWKNN